MSMKVGDYFNKKRTEKYKTVSAIDVKIAQVQDQRLPRKDH